MEKRRAAYRVSVGKPEGRKQRGRPWLTWEVNIEMGLKEMGLDRSDSG